MDAGPAARTSSAPLLEAAGITKLFGDFRANDAIDLALEPGEIHALLGENGAGKSTLVKIIYGLLQPSAGEIRWMGEQVMLAGPVAARKLGIGMVFQHFSLFENLTVAENIALGLDRRRRACRDCRRRLAQVSRDYGLPLDPRRDVWRSVGRRAPAHRDRARADAGAEAARSWTSRPRC